MTPSKEAYTLRNKLVKELKKVAVTYGAKSPYVMLQLRSVVQYVLTPNDWKVLIKAVLSLGQAVA